MRAGKSVLIASLAAATLSHCTPGTGGQRSAREIGSPEAALELLRAGRADQFWPLLRHTPDPSVRTAIIHSLAAGDVDPAVLVDRLVVERDPSIRRALIIGLGHYGDDRLPTEIRPPVVATLLRWYREDPDPGVHAAIDWLLRHGRQGGRPRALDWGQREALASIDRELAGRPPGDRAWYVTREGQTMVGVRGPVEVRMGSPADEEGRVPASDSPEEPLRTARLPRSFAIASKETTVAEFRRFLDANPEVRARHAYPDDGARMAQVLQRFSPEDEGPQVAVTWYEAAMYCNWLSLREGIPESEWVYPSNPAEIRDGMRLPDDYLRRTGYRLPTEAEWEYAARAGAVTSRFFGASDSLLDRFAWYSKNPPRSRADPVDPRDPQRTWPVGQLEPNDLGLFDVYGNVWEWMQDRMVAAPPAAAFVDVEDGVRTVTDSVPRSRRGGSFPYGAEAMRSAGRGTVGSLPMPRRDNVGFRIARTLSTWR